MENLEISSCKNGEDTFTGEFKQVFDSSGAYGGENLAMAAKAALMTIEDRKNYLINSVHCYYVRAGKKGQVSYHVNRVKDGQTFCFRNVVGTQDNKPIITCLVSFKSIDNNQTSDLLHNKYPMPLAGQQELDESVPNSKMASVLSRGVTEDLISLKIRFHSPASSHLKTTRDKLNLVHPDPVEPKQMIWMKPSSTLHSMDQNDHRLAVIYASDHCMSGLILYKYPEYEYAFGTSLDHSVCFHSNCINFNDWHVFDIECNFSAGEVGLNTSKIYNRNGDLVASATQQGYTRIKPKL